MKQQERQERSRREIFQAAMEEFGAHGYDKVSMENLCTRHGISKGMMYHYYSNKDELFLLCVQDVFQNLKAQIEQEIALLENNVGFFAKSKNAEALIAEVRAKIDRAREELAATIEKVKLIDRQAESDAGGQEKA